MIIYIPVYTHKDTRHKNGEIEEQQRSSISHLYLQSTKLIFIETRSNDDVYLLWLTNDQEENENESLNGINIRILHANNSLINFISELLTSNVFLIIDYGLVSTILSFLDDFSQIVFIYVLKNEQSNSTLILTDSKRSFRKISDNKEELFQLINEDIDTCTKDSICSTIFDLATTEESTNQTKNTSFIWYYLLIESLFDKTVYNNNAKSDFIEYCGQQDAITVFENDYSSDNPIRWYTRDSFIYRQLNKALRTRDIDAIFKFRFFIIDFQKQIEQNYNEEVIESLQTVYRGQLMSQLELNKLKHSIGKYISLNTYLSATLDKQIAGFFAGQTKMSVIFEIEVHYALNLKNKRTRPVYVQDRNSVQMEDQRWHIKLKLTDDNNDNQMIDLIQTVYMENIPTKVKFVTLLVSLGDYEKAEQYIEILMEDLELSSDNVNIGYAYNLLGHVWLERGDYQYALPYFEKALNNMQLENIFLLHGYM